LGFAGSNNFYVYCENDPVNSIDPNGLQPSLANDIRDFFGASTDALTTIPFTDYSALDLFGDYGKYNPCSDAAKAGSWYGTAIGLAGAAKSLYSLGKGLLKGGAKKGVQVSESIIKGFTGHATDQAITRGFKTSDILKIVKEGKPVEAMGRYGSQTRYTLGGNTVVVNAQGKVVTVFSNAKGTAKGLGKGYFIPLK